MESVDEIQARHRRELRDLQGRITNKKKNATKKTRKGVNDECAALEQALKQKHQEELRTAEGGAGDAGGAGDIDGMAEQLADTSIGEPEKEPEKEPEQIQTQTQTAKESPHDTQTKKRNRQKERLARRAAEQEAAAAAAADEASNMVDYAAVERAAMLPLIARSGRIEHPIRPDGHCLFSSVADQLGQLGKTLSSSSVTTASTSAEPYRVVRRVAAEYMEAHPDDFAPFVMAAADSPSSSNDTDLLAMHIAQIRDTAEWGGQMELVALANAYGVNIRVLHDGRSELIEPAVGSGSKDDQCPTLWLVYYRHGFGLGEHYNSLRAKPTAA